MRPLQCTLISGQGQDFDHGCCVWPSDVLCVAIRLQRCIKEVSRLTERASCKGGLEKTQLQQLDRNLNELARTLASKVDSILPLT